MKAPIRLAVLLLLASLSALATDLTLTMTGTGKGHDGEQTQYWSSKFMRTNNGASQIDSMVDFEKGVSYTIDHKKKLVQQVGWDDLEASMEAMADKMKDLPAFAQKLMGGGDATVTAEEQGAETILGRKCKKWKITMGQMGGNSAGMLKLGEELAKVQGIALRTHTVLPFVGDLTSVATAIKEGPIPAATFSLPEGYKVEDAGKKMRESMAKGR